MHLQAAADDVSDHQWADPASHQFNAACYWLDRVLELHKHIALIDKEQLLKC